MQVALVMFRADGQKRSFPLNRDITVLGRREDCDLRIPIGDVSRKHCRIVRDYDSVRLEDLGSSNGTFCNGVRVQETTLEAGDVLNVGPVVFTIQIDGVPSISEIQAPDGATPSSETAMSGMPRQTAAALSASGSRGEFALSDEPRSDDDAIVEDAFIQDGENELLDAPAASGRTEDALLSNDGQDDNLSIDPTEFDLIGDDSDQPVQANNDLRIDIEEDSKRSGAS